MFEYHCPLCPLVFQYRAEVEWHVREEHRSRAGEEAGLRSELAAAGGLPDRESLRRLRSSRGRPSVTLLLSTAPAATMTGLDIARLRQLAERARRRLYAEPGRDTSAAVVEYRLARAVSAAETLPTQRGVALLVNQHDIGIITLPFAPRDREVVDGSFATRDLEYSLRRYPRYRVLVLGRCPRIFEGSGRHLSEVQPDSCAPDLSQAELLLALQARAAGRLPIVLVGRRRVLEKFRCRSCHPSEVIAEISLPRLRRSAVGDLAAEAVDRWLYNQQQRTVVDLHYAERHHRVVWGLEAAWGALETRTADRLWVEHDYAIPGRILPEGYGVKRTADPAEPGVTDDLVDVLIARAGELGVPVDLLDPGALNRSEPVAARVALAAAIPRSFGDKRSVAIG